MIVHVLVQTILFIIFTTKQNNNNLFWRNNILILKWHQQDSVGKAILCITDLMCNISYRPALSLKLEISTDPFQFVHLISNLVHLCFSTKRSGFWCQFQLFQKLEVPIASCVQYLLFKTFQFLNIILISGAKVLNFLFSGKFGQDFIKKINYKFFITKDNYLYAAETFNSIIHNFRA